MHIKKKPFLAMSFLSLFLAACSGEQNSSQSISSSTIQAVSSADVMFTPQVDFYYSTDGGSTYSNGKKQLPVDTVIYMRIYVSISTTQPGAYAISADVIIPNVEGVDAYYNSGQKITPQQDVVNNELIYPAVFLASSTPEQFILTYKFIPLAASQQVIFVEFDNNILPLYDQQDTVDFIVVESPDA